MRTVVRAAMLAAVLSLASACHREDDFPDSFDPSDFNADGFADVAVGAPLDDAGVPASDRGRVYVTPGPLNFGSTILDGTEDGGRFGFSVAAAGDFNGDGFADLAVGAPFDDADGNATDEALDRGRVFIYLGGPGFPAGVITLSGTEDGGQFGTSVARAGDVDLNGSDDLIVGAPFEDAGGTDRGRAYLFLGGFLPSTTPALTFSGSEDSARLGFAVSSAGDLNGDGFFDWMVGAPGDDNDGNTTSDALDRGRVFVYRGSLFPDNTVDITINGAEDLGQLGTALAGLRDVNGDGTDDILIGAPFEDGDGDTLTAAAPFRGRAYLFFGSGLGGLSSLGSFSASRIFTGGEDGARFGGAVARLGDVNGDGFDDYFIGAPLDDGDGNATEDGVDQGRGFVHFGGSSIDTVADLTISGSEAGARRGAWAASGGDVDGDGFRDFVVGAPLEDVDGNATDDGLDRGRVFFYRGGPSVDPTADSTLDAGLEDDAQAGTSGA